MWNLGPGIFYRGICTQKKANETPYTRGPSFNSVRQVLLGCLSAWEFFGKTTILIAKPKTWENVICVIMDQIKWSKRQQWWEVPLNYP